MLTDGAGAPVAQENWALRAEGGEFVWTIERTWLRELTLSSAGAPALFFSSRSIHNNPSTILSNSVATTFWITPEKLRGWHNPFYRPAEFGWGYKLALENNAVGTEPGGWAVLKLFPAWPHEREPRFAVEGGYLYRRGHFGWLSEVGIVASPEPRRTCRAGDTEKTTLRIAAVPAAATGHQLAVRADDPSGTVEALCRFYGALLNGGCVNDRVHSEWEAPGTCQGNVTLRAPDRHGKPAAARFQGGAQVVVGNIEPFRFGPDQSFTVQAWFQTSSQENQVIASRPGAYSLGVKGGRFSAWIMQDGNQYVEAAGATVVADGTWHHATAVFDRQAQTLTVYLDGRPDGEPQPIAGIGASTSHAPLTLGAFGGAFPFFGTLDEVSVHGAALTPDRFSVAVDYVPVPPARLGAQTGRYTTAPCDWGQTVRLVTLYTTATLGDGTITALVETSNDDFVTRIAMQPIEIPAGVQRRVLPNPHPARHARLVITPVTPADATVSPLLRGIELTGEPVP